MEMNDQGEEKRHNHGNIKILLLLIVIMCAAVQMIGERQSYADSEQNYDELEKQAVTKTENTEENKKEISATNQKYVKERQAPITVDFNSVKHRKEGENVIAWIYVEAVDVSYPILQGDTNQQYLRKNLDGEYAVSGSVFMDAENSSDFTDPNTIIFGHNMADGSMFGKLKRFSLNNALQISSYVWVITEQQEYCYQIFSVQIAQVTDECYTLFSSRGNRFVEFLKRMRQDSIEETGTFEFSETDNILTLSTCNGNNTSSRYVIQAIRIQ